MIGRLLPFIVIILLIFSNFACTYSGNTPSGDLHTQLGEQLTLATQSYNQADELWTTLIDGERPISCAQSIAVPPPFTLTESDAAKNPQSVEVRDYLNAGIGMLQQVQYLWDSECAQPRQLIPLDVLRQMETLLKQAQSDLRLAQEAYTVWQS